MKCAREGCENEFVRIGRQLYCSKYCGQRSWAISKLEPIHLICNLKTCGNPFIWSQVHHKFCSEECAETQRILNLESKRELKNQPLSKKLCFCGSEFISNKVTRKYCSPKCRKHNPEYMKSLRDGVRNSVENLRDSYLLQIFRRHGSNKQIENKNRINEILEEKRISIKIKRLIHEKQRTIKPQRSNGGAIIVLPGVDSNGSLPPEHAEHHKPRKGSRPNRNGNAS